MPDNTDNKPDYAKGKQDYAMDYTNDKPEYAKGKQDYAMDYTNNKPEYAKGKQDYAMDYTDNKPDYANGKQDYAMDNTNDKPDYTTHKEAICNTCGVIWHPRNTKTRRPTRCPYCMSRKTEWLDQYNESHIDEEPVSESAMEDTYEELNESMEYTDDELDYAGNTPEYSDDYSCKKNVAGMPKVVIYVLIGILVLYVIIHILNTWKKSREDNQITKVNSSEVRMDCPHTGIAGMVMQRKHPFGNRVF